MARLLNSDVPDLGKVFARNSGVPFHVTEATSVHVALIVLLITRMDRAGRKPDAQAVKLFSRMSDSSLLKLLAQYSAICELDNVTLWQDLQRAASTLEAQLPTKLEM
jgi:hypothetical protein